MPPAPLVPLPTVIVIAPPVPAVAAPDPIEIVPVVPVDFIVLSSPESGWIQG